MKTSENKIILNNLYNNVNFVFSWPRFANLGHGMVRQSAAWLSL